ncbi:MAG: polysaccharide biosynthesis tyrosine autokinase, partial [Calditrichaeota bacterium]|nr:polysaccharide biosynthesis tyrosine autokinase [Calditrichota bacterium]
MPIDNQDYGYDEVVSTGESSISTRSIFLPMLLAILKRPWLSIGSIFLVTIPIVFYMYSQVPRYRSTSIVTVANDLGDQNLISKVVINPNQNWNDSEEFYLYILDSYSYNDHIVKNILEAFPHLPPDSITDIVERDISHRQKSRSTSFIYIEAESESPDFSRFLAQQAITSFKALSMKLRLSNSSVVADFITNQLDELNAKLSQKEGEIQDFLVDRKLNEVDVATGISSELRGLEQSLTKAKAMREMARLQIETYSSQIENRFNESLDPEDDTTEMLKLDLRNQLDNLNAMLSDSVSFSSDSLEIANVQRERKRILSRLIALMHDNDSITESRGLTLQISADALKKELELSLIQFESAEIECLFYQSAIKIYISEHPNLSQDILEYFNYSRAKSVLQTAINILIEKHETIRIKMAGERGGIRIIDEPRVPSSPIPQNRGRKLAASFLIALAFGFALAYVIDLFDNTIQGEVDIATKFHLPVYGSIPVLSLRGIKSRKHRTIIQPDEINGKVDLTLLNYHSESSPVAEAYRSIRTAVSFTARERQQKAFVISSAVAGEGKSLTTYNLGVSFAQGGFKTLLVDTDLRRSSLHKLFNTDREPGITNYLVGEKTVAEIFLKGNVENLTMVCSGMKVNNPADLLASHKMRQFIDEVSPLFDIILFDTPPITPCMDSRNLANLVGGMIYIVRAELTKLNILEHSIGLTNRVNVEILGVIINYASFRYGYGYYYLYHRYQSYGYYSGGYSYYYYSYYQEQDTS